MGTHLANVCSTLSAVQTKMMPVTKALSKSWSDHKRSVRRSLIKNFGPPSLQSCAVNQDIMCKYPWSDSQQEDIATEARKCIQDKTFKSFKRPASPTESSIAKRPRIFQNPPQTTSFVSPFRRNVIHPGQSFLGRDFSTGPRRTLSNRGRYTSPSTQPRTLDNRTSAAEYPRGSRGRSHR